MGWESGVRYYDATCNTIIFLKVIPIINLIDSIFDESGGFLMRPKIVVILSLLLLLFTIPAYSQDTFTKGVNLSSWFQEDSVRAIQFNKYTQKDFQDIKSLGCDVIRLPINLHFMTSGAPDYKIDPLFFQFMDEVVNRCEALNISLILDNHTFDPSKDTKASIEPVLLKVWAQMAEHYESRGDFLYYEILNEPHGIDPVAWGKIERNVLKEIRQFDQKHTVIVGGANWNDIDSMYLLPDFKDDKIIYTFHFYDPFVFTHQGADWAEPSLLPLKDVPYPYVKEKMPPCPKELLNTWIQNSIQSDYPKNGNNKALEKLLWKAANFRDKTGKPVFCGEFGVYNRNSPDEDRIYWYESVRMIFEKFSIPWTSWDYRDAFGLFKKGSDGTFESDLNLPLLKALGFNEVPQNEFKISPDAEGFDLFNQYPAQRVSVSSYITHGKIDFYDDTVLDNKRFAIRMENLARYNNLHFEFKPRKDLSLLFEKKYNFVIKIRLKPNFKDFDIRFLSVRKGDPLSVPWRMGYTFNKSTLQSTTDWQTVVIPLENFREQGAWKDKWYNPEGLFDWSRITSLEIVSENGNWQNTGIYIAEMKLALAE
jgi:endoglucanase